MMGILYYEDQFDRLSNTVHHKDHLKSIVNCLLFVKIHSHAFYTTRIFLFLFTVIKLLTFVLSLLLSII